MDLKDYLRVIRRRALEFGLVFLAICCMYMYVSKKEQTYYVANAQIELGAKDYEGSAKNKLTFLRNRSDLEARLSDRSRDGKYPLIAKRVVDKMELAKQAGTVDKLSEEDKLLFYASGSVSDGIQANFNDLLNTRKHIEEQLSLTQTPVTPESIHAQVMDGFKSVVVGAASEGNPNLLILSAQSLHESFSRILVNEAAWYFQNDFNNDYNEKLKARAKDIDFWYKDGNTDTANPKIRADNARERDEIDKLYNRVVSLYKDHLTAKFQGKDEEAAQIEADFVSEFRPLFEPHGISVNKNFHEAFSVDLLREHRRELAEIGNRYNNVRSFSDITVDMHDLGYEGSAPKSHDEIKELLKDIRARKQEHAKSISALSEEEKMLNLRYLKLSSEQRQLILESSDQRRNLIEKRDSEEVALQQLRSKYTDEHPQVQQALRNIEQLKMLTQEMDERFSKNDDMRYGFRITEIETLRRHHDDEILALTSQEDKLHAIVERINDLDLHLMDILKERDRVMNKSNDLKDELADLKAQIQAGQIVKLTKIAQHAPEAVRTYTKKTMVLSLMVALIISVFFVYIREYMDTSIKTEHDVRRHMNLPVLAMIGKAKKEVILTELPSKDPFAEHFNTAATLVKSAAVDLGLKSFLVTSTVPQEGKTTICVDLAIALARKGLRIIVVDGDLRIPTIHEVLGLDNSQGLSSILEGRTTPGDDTDFTGMERYIQSTSIENLRVLTSGPIPADPINLLESVRMRALVEELKGMCDYLIMDTPPIYNVGDTLTMASLVDATLFVVGAERVEQDQVTWAKHLLTNVNANILGVFLNMVRVPGKSYYYYYNGYKSYRSRA
ncbi:MAG: polysaccharide biosynthesis tyrosine autokinase [Planctomycetota bacterium]